MEQKWGISLKWINIIIDINTIDIFFILQVYLFVCLPIDEGHRN